MFKVCVHLGQGFPDTAFVLDDNPYKGDFQADTEELGLAFLTHIRRRYPDVVYKLVEVDQRGLTLRVVQ
jgi:hypothetical protein